MCGLTTNVVCGGTGDEIWLSVRCGWLFTFFIITTGFADPDFVLEIAWVDVVYGKFALTTTTMLSHCI